MCKKAGVYIGQQWISEHLSLSSSMTWEKNPKKIHSSDQKYDGICKILPSKSRGCESEWCMKPRLQIISDNIINLAAEPFNS